MKFIERIDSMVYSKIPFVAKMEKFCIIADGADLVSDNAKFNSLVTAFEARRSELLSLLDDKADQKPLIDTINSVEIKPRNPSLVSKTNQEEIFYRLIN